MPRKMVKAADSEQFKPTIVYMGGCRGARGITVRQVPEDVMLGKLRHLMNTMEVCCLNPNPTNLTAYGWVLYHQKN